MEKYKKQTDISTHAYTYTLHKCTPPYTQTKNGNNQL